MSRWIIYNLNGLEFKIVLSSVAKSSMIELDALPMPLQMSWLRLCYTFAKMNVRKSDGFTIVELLVTIAVFGLIVPALTTGVNNLLVLSNRTRDLTLANILAENKAELLRSRGFNSLSLGTVSFTNELPDELSSPKSATYTITSPSLGLVEIDINISYRDYNQTRSLQYKTMVSELGVGQ